MFVRNLSVAQLDALEVVETRAERVKVVEKEYEEAVINAFQLNIPNQVIAHRLGQSETAVRTWLRRRGYTRR